MAEAAVKTAADWLGKLLVEEGKYLWGAAEKIEELQDELLWMQSFLRDADTIKYDDEIVRMWVHKVKEYVAEAEDIIDDFVIRIVSRRKRTGWKIKLERYSCFLGELVALHQVASRIDCLKNKISMLSPRLKKYGLKTSYSMKTHRNQEAQTQQVQQSLKYRHLDNKEIIGLEQNAEDIVYALKNSGPGRRVVAIYGMGGLGKTTLATKVYHHNEIKNHFIGGRAWVYISQQFQVQSVIQSLLIDLTSNSPETFSRKDVKELIPELLDLLKKKKCLVVLDDVWNQRAWEILKAAFNTCGGESGSRVLLTTRKEEVAKYVDLHPFHKPDPLNDEESWRLLQQNVGWLKMDSDGSSETDNQKKDGNGKAQTESVGSSETDIHRRDEHGRAQGENVGGSSEADIIKSDGDGRAKTENVGSSEADIIKSDGDGRVKTENFRSSDGML